MYYEYWNRTTLGAFVFYKFKYLYFTVRFEDFLVTVKI
jgi:hypothetical protein